MSQKKAAGTASQKTTSTKPPTNASTKAKLAATKKAPAKATTKAATKPSTKAAPKAPAKRATKPTSKAPATAPPKTSATKVAANTSKKRKATDELEEQEPKVNGVKRARTTSKSATPAPAAASRKAAAKPKAVKAPKKKAVINNAPTDRLDIYVFGTGDNGELGLGSAKGQTEVKRPRLNPLVAADNVGVVSMSVGGMHAAVLTQNNEIMTWGVNDQGALGRDTSGWQGGLKDVNDNDSDRDSDGGSDTDINPLESTPTEIDMSGLPEGIVWTQLACTDSATFALTDEGLVYGWGTFRVSHPFFFPDRYANISTGQ
jgi:regulator of chromosome condensation